MASDPGSERETRWRRRAYRLDAWALALNSPHHQFSFTLGQSSDGCFECASKYTSGGNRRHLPRATDERTKKTHRSQAGRGMGGRSIPQISNGVNKVIVLSRLWSRSGRAKSGLPVGRWLGVSRFASKTFVYRPRFLKLPEDVILLPLGAPPWRRCGHLR